MCTVFFLEHIINGHAKRTILTWASVSGSRTLLLACFVTSLIAVWILPSNIFRLKVLSSCSKGKRLKAATICLSHCLDPWSSLNSFPIPHMSIVSRGWMSLPFLFILSYHAVKQVSCKRIHFRIVADPLSIVQFLPTTCTKQVLTFPFGSAYYFPQVRLLPTTTNIFLSQGHHHDWAVENQRPK